MHRIPHLKKKNGICFTRRNVLMTIKGIRFQERITEKFGGREKELVKMEGSEEA